MILLLTTAKNLYCVLHPFLKKALMPNNWFQKLLIVRTDYLSFFIHKRNQDKFKFEELMISIMVSLILRLLIYCELIKYSKGNKVAKRFSDYLKGHQELLVDKIMKAIAILQTIGWGWFRIYSLFKKTACIVIESL